MFTVFPIILIAVFSFVLFKVYLSLGNLTLLSWWNKEKQEKESNYLYIDKYVIKLPIGNTVVHAKFQRIRECVLELPVSEHHRIQIWNYMSKYFPITKYYVSNNLKCFIFSLAQGNTFQSFKGCLKPTVVPKFYIVMFSSIKDWQR